MRRSGRNSTEVLSLVIIKMALLPRALGRDLTPRLYADEPPISNSPVNLGGGSDVCQTFTLNHQEKHSMTRPSLRTSERLKCSRCADFLLTRQEKAEKIMPKARLSQEFVKFDSPLNNLGWPVQMSTSHPTHGLHVNKQSSRSNTSQAWNNNPPISQRNKRRNSALHLGLMSPPSVVPVWEDGTIYFRSCCWDPISGYCMV